MTLSICDVVDCRKGSADYNGFKWKMRDKTTGLKLIVTLNLCGQHKKELILSNWEEEQLNNNDKEEANTDK